PLSPPPPRSPLFPYTTLFRSNRADPWLQLLLTRVPMYAQRDDHEVLNDSGGSWAYWKRGTEEWRGYSNLQQVGREMFFNYNPIRSEEHTSELQSRFDLVCRLL